MWRDEKEIYSFQEKREEETHDSWIINQKGLDTFFKHKRHTQNKQVKRKLRQNSKQTTKKKISEGFSLWMMNEKIVMKGVHF